MGTEEHESIPLQGYLEMKNKNQVFTPRVFGTEEHESSLHSKGIWKWRTRTCVMVLYYIVKLSNVEREIKKQI